MADDWQPAAVTDIPSGGPSVPATTDWTPATVTDIAPAGPQPLAQLPPAQESDYQQWIKDHRVNDAHGNPTPEVSSPAMGKQTVTVDPYGNGVDTDLRRAYSDSANMQNFISRWVPADPTQTPAANFDPGPDTLEKYATTNNPQLTSKSMFAGKADPSKLGSWSTDDSGNRVYNPPGTEPESTTRKIMDKATNMVTDDLHNAATSVTHPEQMLDNAEDFGVAAAKGLGQSFHGAMEDVNIAGGALPVLYDQAKSYFTGETTTVAQDAWFHSTVDPLTSQDDAFQLAKNAGFPDKVAQSFGGALGTISQAVLTGGESVPLEASATGGEAVAAAVTHGTKSMALPATSAAIDTGRRVYDQTGDAAAAVKAAQVQWLVTTAGGIAPLAAPGATLAGRAAQGAVAGAATSEGSRQAMNAALPAGMQQDFDPEDAALGAISGAVMGAGGGHGQPGAEEAPTPTGIPGADDMAQRAGAGGIGPAGGAPALERPWSGADAYNAFWEAKDAVDKGNMHIADPIVSRANREADIAEAAARAAPTNPDLVQRATDARQVATTLNELVNKPSEQAAADSPTPSNRRAANSSKVAQITLAARDPGDIDVVPSDDGHVVTVAGEPVATFKTEGAATAAADDARENVTDRRTDAINRQSYGQATPDQIDKTLQTHPVTGIPNRAAYNGAERQPAQVSIDAQSRKVIDAPGGHQAAEQIQKAVAQALHQQSPGNAYHMGGDHFVLQAADADTAASHMQAVQQRLAGALVHLTSPAGRNVTIRGIGVSHAIGSTLREASTKLRTQGAGPDAAGVRTARGQPSSDAAVADAGAGLQDHGDNAAENPASEAPRAERNVPAGHSTVLGQVIERPAKPTPAQQKAGNYRKPEVSWQGLPIKVENTKGQYRSGKTYSGKPFRSQMKADYGYFPGTTANDGEGVDVMMGPHHDSDRAYVIDQLTPDGKRFDEHKVQIGVRSADEAKAQYLAHYPKNWKGLGGVTELSVGDLKRWLKAGDHTLPIDAASVPAAKREGGQGPNAKHDSILEYLARHDRGLDREEAEAQGIDKADMGLPTATVGIKRAFRKGGMTFDEAAEHLSESGYPVTDEQGHYNPNTLLDRITDELAGTKHYSVHSDKHVPEIGELAEGWRRLSDEELAKLPDADLARYESHLERMAIQSEDEESEDRIPFARQDDLFGGTSKEIKDKPKARAAEQTDLFGDKVAIANELKRIQAARDKKRNTGQESAETGRPDDLFSAANRQTDIENKPAESGNAPAKVDNEPPVSGQTVADRLTKIEAELGLKPTGALEDAGEKIGGARKDKWAERGMRLSDLDNISESEAANLVNKKAVWNPDWQKLIDGGMPREVAALNKVLFDQLAARPRYNTPDGRRHYVETLGRVRDMMLEAKDRTGVAGIENRLATDLNMPRGYSIAATPEQKLARDQFWSIQKGRRSTLRVAYSDDNKAKGLLEAGWPAKKPNTDTGEAGPKPKRPDEPKRPHLDEINRIGPPVREGDVTSTDFIKAFGFRGLEFGNWAANDERQRLVNHAYEALHDLARILGVPPKALSLNGTMGLALGARGGGRFAAHYEPGKMVINMTKINGAGALAHEWGHALDHYMGENGRPDAYTTKARGATGWYDDRRSLGHLRPEMQAAWEGVMQAMYKRQVPAAEFIRDHELATERVEGEVHTVAEALKESPDDPNLQRRKEWIERRAEATRQFLKELRENPQESYTAGPTKYVKDAARLGDYWRRPTEMFARAFEGYVQDKIKAEGGQSDYLVQGAEGERHAEHPKGNPYPLEDRPQINKAIQHLVDTLETRTEGDKEVLFRRGAGPGLPTEQVKATVSKILKGFATQPSDAVVVRSQAYLPRELAPKIPADVPAFTDPSTGKIYFIANRIHSADHAAALVAHEYVTHFGLRAALGSRNEPAYQAILDGVTAAMPADVRQRGEAEFGDRYNQMNRNHRSVAAEETLAYYSEKYAADQSIPARIKRWLDKWHGMIRDWIRKVLNLPAKFDDLFMKRTVSDLETYLRRPHNVSTPEAEEPAFERQHDTFFSGLARAVDAAKREKGTGAEWEATLRNMQGVKPEEIEWTGLKDWLEGRGRVTKAEVADYVAAHRVHLGEVVKGGSGEQPPLTDEHIAHLDAMLRSLGLEEIGPEQGRVLREGGSEAAGSLDDLEERVIGSPLGPEIPRATEEATKYGNWATPGGKNYRELLMTMPEDPARERFNDLQGQLRKATTTHTYAMKGLGDLADLARNDYARVKNWLERGTHPEEPEERRDEALQAARDFVAGKAGSFQDEAFERMAEASVAQREMHALNRALDEYRINPPSRPFKGGHWDEPNVLAHVRFDDREGAHGERILHVNEIQSDWHQKGRREGYKKNNPTQEDAKKFFGISDNVWSQLSDDQKESYRLEAASNERHVTQGTVPDAPFKTTWPELAMKRMLRYAAEHGYDALSWDTGDTNAERFNMSKIADRIQVTPEGNGPGERLPDSNPFAESVRSEERTYHVLASMKGQTVAEHAGLPGRKLADYLGKDMAQKAISADAHTEFTGEQLKIGGSGMRGFYDDILPKAVNKLVKKWGGEVEQGHVAITHEAGMFRNLQGNLQQATEPTTENLPIYRVDITPKMRDSVMEGQPLFARTPAAAPPMPPHLAPGTVAGGGGKAYGAIRKAATSLVDNRLVMDVRKLLNPKDVSLVSKDVARRTSTFLGDLAQMKAQTQERLETFSRALEKLSPDDQLNMIDAIETGKPQPIPDMQPIADAFRQMLDHWRDQVRALGAGHLDNFLENYFPHYWKDHADSAAKMFASIQGRRTMRGPATFLKQRTVPTIKQGIAWGLTPLSINPATMVLMKVHEMQRFISGVRMLQHYKDVGLAAFLPSMKPVPPEWKEIDDPIARVSSYSEEEGGFVQRGRYIMPEDGARIINNHLSTSALRNFAPVQAVRFVSNLLNSLQLGFSAFHLGFTTMDAIVSKNALGFERMMSGEPLRAMAAFAEAATGPIAAAANMRRGYKLLQAYLDPAGATPEWNAIAEAFMKSGGRAHMDRFFLPTEGESPFRGTGMRSLFGDIRSAMTQPRGKVAGVTKAISSFPMDMGQKIWNGLRTMARINPWFVLPFEVTGRMTRATTSLIMETIVPLQKMGVFADMASDILRRNAGADPVEMNSLLQSAQRSVDNRLGEMVYDNKFWNRTFKDTLHLMIRAVGWNFGTVEEIGGAPFDILKGIDKGIRTGKIRGQDFGHKAAYVMGLAMTQAMVGATLQYLMTGEGPKDLKDLMFPRTGKFLPDGTAERISLPSYVKDIYEYIHHPGTTVLHKANPLFGVIGDQWNGTDYFGDPIYNPDASATEQWEQRAEHLGQSYLPFSLEGSKHMVGADDPGFKGMFEKYGPYVGLTPAPGAVTKPEKIEAFEHYQQQKAWMKKLQFDLKRARADGDKQKIADVQRQIADAKRAQSEEHREYERSKNEAAKAARARKQAGQTSQLMQRVGPLIDSANSREEMAANIRQSGLPALADLIGSLPDRLRPQQAAAIAREST